jgi:hypothetical protein
MARLEILPTTSGATGAASEDTITLWAVDYEYENQIWRTVVEHYTRELAMEKFRRDHPNVELRECYQP